LPSIKDVADIKNKSVDQ